MAEYVYVKGDCHICGDYCAGTEMMFGKYDLCETCTRLVLRIISKDMNEAEHDGWIMRAKQERDSCIKGLTCALAAFKESQDEEDRDD